MAYITDFSVEHLAGRKEEVSLHLNRDTNVFFGLNGAGKTTLLKILHSAMSQDAAILQAAPFTAAQVKIYSVAHDREYTLSLKRPVSKQGTRVRGSGTMQIDPTLIDFTTLQEVWTTHQATLFEDAEDKLRWRITPEPPPSPSKGWTHSWLPISRLYLSPLRSARFQAAERLSVSEEQLDELFSGAMSQIWSSYNNTVLSQVGRAQAVGLTNVLRAVLSPQPGFLHSPSSAFDIEQSYARMQAFLARQGARDLLGSLDQFASLMRDRPDLASVVNDIDAVELQIEQITAPRRRLEDLIHRLFSGPKEIKFSDRAIEVVGADKAKISLAALSSGEKHALRILTESLLAGSNSILVDEPELSLHVDWQKVLVSSIHQLNPDCQLILATHSPEIMADLPDSNIFRL